MKVRKIVVIIILIVIDLHFSTYLFSAASAKHKMFLFLKGYAQNPEIQRRVGEQVGMFVANNALGLDYDPKQIGSKVTGPFVMLLENEYKSLFENSNKSQIMNSRSKLAKPQK